MTRPQSTPRIVVSANSLWNIHNFRRDLIEALDRNGWSVIIAAPATPEECRSWPGPGRVVSIDICRSGTNPFRDLNLFRRYYQLLCAERPAAYLSWTIKPNLYGGFAAWTAGVPALANVSGLGTAFLSGGLLGRFVSLLYKLAFRRSAVVYFQNVDDRNLFVGERLVRADQARLLPGSGINLKRFAMTALPLGGGIRFLMVARLLGDKGVRDYVEAARLARRIVPEARFGLLGAIDDGNRTAISAEELGEWVRDGVIDYLGEVSDVRPQLAAATVVVLPSYREGLPRSLLEGAAMGRPLIATDVPGCRELVEDSVNGFLCLPRDPNSLSAAMIRMAKLDESLRAKMGARSRQVAEARFSDELVTRAYVMALAEIEGRGTVRS